MGRKRGMQGLWLTPAELQGFPFKQGQLLNQETPSTLAPFERYSLPSSKASYQQVRWQSSKIPLLKHLAHPTMANSGIPPQRCRGRKDERTTYSATFLPIGSSSKLYLIFTPVVRGVCVCIRACPHTHSSHDRCKYQVQFAYRAPNQLLTSLGKLIISYFPDKFSV